MDNAFLSPGIVIKAVSDWAVLPNVGQQDFGDAGDRQVFAAYDKDEGIGLIIIRTHFRETMEICWIGVHPHHQNKGVGNGLIRKALDYARDNGHKFAVVSLPHSLADDIHHNQRRALYLRHDFKPLMKAADKDQVNPAMWMIKVLG